MLFLKREKKTMSLPLNIFFKSRAVTLTGLNRYETADDRHRLACRHHAWEVSLESKLQLRRRHTENYLRLVLYFVTYIHLSIQTSKHVWGKGKSGRTELTATCQLYAGLVPSAMENRSPNASYGKTQKYCDIHVSRQKAEHQYVSLPHDVEKRQTQFCKKYYKQI